MRTEFVHLPARGELAASTTPLISATICPVDRECTACPAASATAESIALDFHCYRLFGVQNQYCLCICMYNVPFSITLHFCVFHVSSCSSVTQPLFLHSLLTIHQRMIGFCPRIDRECNGCSFHIISNITS